MLTVENLSKQFTLHILNGKQLDACRDVSFTVPKGRFLGLAGPSGAGKSTVLKCIYRTYLPSSGSVNYESPSYGAVDLATLPEREVIDIRTREMGYVSQFLKVVPRVSALDVVMEPILARNNVTREEARERAVQLLKRLRIQENLFDAYPATFSGGEQQRVNIAHGVSWRPRLLLLDEPTASLDRESVGIVVEILKDLRAEGTTMIGIFHDHDLMASVTDDVYHIN
ncbi:MAG TPA: phosphonate C-P lyase system protein PhnL [Desulfuromonadales bacterium]|nr:phosphonate C-P lyase system protein PhnL [Desulfuromonadales bacterium]